MTDPTSATYLVELKSDANGQFVEIPDEITLPWGPCTYRRKEDGSIVVEPAPRGRSARLYYNVMAWANRTLRAVWKG